MSANKHTSGPWNITEDLGMDEAWCNWHRVGPVDLMGGKADANSRLIAAAPDMLDALRSALPALESMQRLMSGIAAARGMGGDGPLLDAVRSAIAKAEGLALPLHEGGGE